MKGFRSIKLGEIYLGNKVWMDIVIHMRINDSNIELEFPIWLDKEYLDVRRIK